MRMLDVINKHLSGIDVHLYLFELLQKEFPSLRESLEFSQAQMEQLLMETISLQESVSSLTKWETRFTEGNEAIQASKEEKLKKIQKAMKELNEIINNETKFLVQRLCLENFEYNNTEGEYLAKQLKMN